MVGDNKAKDKPESKENKTLAQAAAAEAESAEAKSEVDAAESPVPPELPARNSRLSRFKNWYKTHKKLAIPLTILVIVLLILAIPITRYQSLGLVLKKDYSIQVIDSSTKDPVSGATVTFGSISAQTDGSGIAKLNKVKVGPHQFSVSKKYYKDGSLTSTVPLLSQKDTPQHELTATGRQVKVSIINTINKKPLSDVKIKVADIAAQTDSKGDAALVLPPGVAEQKAELSLDGYVTSSVVIKVSENKVEENKFNLAPAGKVYFLSKRTGKIDVMKSNLDGTDQQIVLAATGKEDDADTILLASRDWKYLVLKSKRDDGKPKLYWIDTSTDKLNTLDEGDADFTVIGWSEHYFNYRVHRNSVGNGQPNRQALKSFNAENAKLAILNQTAGATNDSGYAHEVFSNFFIIDDTLVFEKTWDRSYDYYGGANPVIGKSAGIYSIRVDGTGFKTLKTLPYDDSNDYYYFSSVLYAPKEIYYRVYVNDAYKYYEYDNGAFKEDDGLKEAYDKFVGSTYPTYLLSPSGKQTFWVQPRDGKHSFLVGDDEGQNEKEIAKLEDKFQNYGYYTDEYALISKNSSELYVIPSFGVKDVAELVKITDYHRPDYVFYGYGGGYGGL